MTIPILSLKRPSASDGSAVVETVRIFTASGHPWIGFAALVVWRLPSILLLAVLLTYGITR